MPEKKTLTTSALAVIASMLFLFPAGCAGTPKTGFEVRLRDKTGESPRGLTNVDRQKIKELAAREAKLEEAVKKFPVGSEGYQFLSVELLENRIKLQKAGYNEMSNQDKGNLSLSSGSAHADSPARSGAASVQRMLSTV